MLRKMFIIILLTGTVITCNAQNDNMAEKYDFELMKKVKQETGNTSTIAQKGDTLVYISPMSESGAFYREYPPLPAFYTIHKNFFSNGNIKSKVEYVGEFVYVGETILYDEKGYMTKVDEDKKFGEIKLNWILRFLEKEGCINLETGEGREAIAFNQSNVGYIEKGAFELKFLQKGEESKDYPIWYITIKASPKNHFYRTSYKIHGDTGEILSKETKKVLKRE